MSSSLSEKRFVLTGAPGVGKTSLIQELSARGFSCTDEPAREIIAEQRLIGGSGIWERDTKLFLELLLSRSIDRYKAASEQVLTTYDRGIPDCIAYALCAGLPLQAAENAANLFRYEKLIFVVPPWEAIYRTDDERTMTFEQTWSFHEHIVDTYSRLGYELQEIPKISVTERADFVCSYLPESFSGV
jgi:predicted ATPase